MLDSELKVRQFRSPPGKKCGSKYLPHLHPLANSTIMSTLTVHCRLEDETARERIGHLPSYTMVKKIIVYRFICGRAYICRCVCTCIV